MPRDKAIPQWAIDQRAQQHRRDREFMAEFARILPAWYPAPRFNFEGQAYCYMRRFWTWPQIRLFIASYATDHSLFPGVLDTPGYPTLEEFMRDIGTLAEGEYARSLPKKVMLTLVAGEDAARGAGTRDSAAEGGKKRSRERRAATAGRDKAMAEEYLKRIKGAGRRSDTVIREDIGKGHGLKKTASISAINRGLKILSG
jgi:hypothetical protein